MDSSFSHGVFSHPGFCHSQLRGPSLAYKPTTSWSTVMAVTSGLLDSRMVKRMRRKRGKGSGTDLFTYVFIRRLTEALRGMSLYIPCTVLNHKTTQQQDKMENVFILSNYFQDTDSTTMKERENEFLETTSNYYPRYNSCFFRSLFMWTERFSSLFVAFKRRT